MQTRLVLGYYPLSCVIAVALKRALRSRPASDVRQRSRATSNSLLQLSVQDSSLAAELRA